MTDSVTVEQCDRDAAAALLIFAGEKKAYREGVLAGRHDGDAYVVICARHRIAERERCAGIAYRTCAETHHVTLGDKCAQAIREPKP